ncbi:hypothetical protein BY996DRAFT_8397051 [Phakopsora pachyrhizi]|nr:hypothetical protein BY996DRAFT_8397051 [Phakopsora pachyrhizi]
MSEIPTPPFTDYPSLLSDFHSGNFLRPLLEPSDAGLSQAESNPSLLSRFSTVSSLLGRASKMLGDTSRDAIETVGNLNRRFRSSDVILTLQKIILDEYKPDPEFIEKASKTFQSYAQYILKDVNLEFENHRISLLMDLMRIFCPIFGHVGTEKMTESKETLIILAKGIQPIIKGLFDRGEIQNIWKLESYKKIFAYEYITLEFKDINNQEINDLMNETHKLLKSSEKLEEEHKESRYNLLKNLLNVKSLPENDMEANYFLLEYTTISDGSDGPEIEASIYKLRRDYKAKPLSL